MSEVPWPKTDRTDVVVLCGCASLILAAAVTVILGSGEGVAFWGFPLAWRKTPGLGSTFQMLALLVDIAVWWVLFFAIALLATRHTAKDH